ncbi:MAG: AMP-binding protein, partial [Gammaproteobacteria bacterium]|nr:AMP-binding protein [Gammaproteobacteria bacterium]
MAYLLSHLLSTTAARVPGKTAVTCAGRALSYGQLEDESNRLAGLLRREGVQPGDRVGIYLNKSVETVLGIFAILKAGAAYVPLDPMAPAQRLGLILRDCAVRHLLTTSAKVKALTPGLFSQWGVELVLLMDGSPETPAEDGPMRWRLHRDADAETGAAPENPAIESDLAYILYTSGSTGVPKGVMISHRNALAFIDWVSECFDVREDDQFSNHAPFHFDLSILDLFVSVKIGATVHLVPEMAAFFPASLIQFIESNRISVWYSVPSVL